MDHACPLFIEHLGAEGLDQQQDELLDIYRQVYQERLSDPFHATHRYWDRLQTYGSRAGFSMVTGAVDGAVVGYALGYRLPLHSGWWRGLITDVDPALTEETGDRTFALNEMMVLPQWRRRHYARQLHDVLLRGRSEERATLLVRPGNVAARAAYVSWGWNKVGELQPFGDAPIYDAMILPLSSEAASL